MKGMNGMKHRNQPRECRGKKMKQENGERRKKEGMRTCKRREESGKNICICLCIIL